MGINSAELIRRRYQTERAKTAEAALREEINENRELKEIIKVLLVLLERAIRVAEGANDHDDADGARVAPKRCLRLAPSRQPERQRSDERRLQLSFWSSLSR
jgi:hypothetical protein